MVSTDLQLKLEEVRNVTHLELKNPLSGYPLTKVDCYMAYLGSQ